MIVNSIYLLLMFATCIVEIVFVCDFRQESTIASLREWLADPTVGNNATIRLIAGTIFLHEEDYSEALKHTNAGGTMDL